jgi:hypothetical protein
MKNLIGTMTVYSGNVLTLRLPRPELGTERSS